MVKDLKYTRNLGNYTHLSDSCVPRYSNLELNEPGPIVGEKYLHLKCVLTSKVAYNKLL